MGVVGGGGGEGEGGVEPALEVDRTNLGADSVTVGRLPLL